MNAVRVGRGTPWGNPYRVGAVCRRCGEEHLTAGSTLACFIDWAESVARFDAQWLRPLYNKRLLCPGCPPGSPTCHARILETMAAKQQRAEAIAYMGPRLSTVGPPPKAPPGRIALGDALRADEAARDALREQRRPVGFPCMRTMRQAQRDLRDARPHWSEVPA